MTHEEKARVEALAHLNHIFSAMASLNNTGVRLLEYSTAEELSRLKRVRKDLEGRVAGDIERTPWEPPVRRPQQMERGPDASTG